MNDHIHRYVEDSRRLASLHPESSLSMARKAAEAVCKAVHEEKLGPTGSRATLDDLIGKLSQNETIPKQIQVPLRTIQAYGNLAAHDQGGGPAINGRYIQPALQALDTLMQWFVEEFSTPEERQPAVQRSTATSTDGLVGAHMDPTATVEPAKSLAHDLAPVYGRDDELRRLFAAVDAIAGETAGPGRVLLLAGTSGTGKSMLAESLIRYAASRGLSIHRATCEPFHEGMSFYPIRELLRQLASAQGAATDLALAFGGSSSQFGIARLMDAADADPAARRDALIATFANQVFARAILDKAPLLLFVDDLERIDTGSVDALLCLNARLREGPVLVMGAYRSDVVGAAGGSIHPLRPVISAVRRGDKLAEMIELKPLAEDAMTGLVEALLRAPSDLPSSFMRRLFDETEGNPLYVREVLRALAAERSGSDEAPLRQVSGVWKLVRRADAWEIPRSIEDAIGSRLLGINELERSVLETAAVIGRRFRFEVLLDLGVASEDALIRVLERHLELDLVREVPQTDNVFEFTHGKIREVLYNGMTGLRRGRLHGQVADVLSRHQSAIPAEEWDVLVGAHLFAARRYSLSAPHLLRAGQRALEVQASTDAAHHLRRALEAFEKSPETPRETLDRTRLLLGTALKAANEFDAAEAQFLLTLRDGHEAYARRWSLNHLGDVSLVQGRVKEALERYSRCEQLARDEGDTELLAETSANLAELHMRQGEQLAGVDSDRATEHTAEYERYLDLEQELAHKVGHRHALARAYRNSAKRARTRGDIPVAIALYEQSIEYADAAVNSHRFLIPYAKALRLVGRHADASEIVRKVLDWSRQIGARRSEAIARQYLGLIAMEQQLKSSTPDFTTVRTEMARALALHLEVGFEQGRRETEVDLAELEAHQGNREQVLRHLELAVNPTSPRTEQQVCHAVLSQLRANGEPVRADRFQRALVSIGISE